MPRPLSKKLKKEFGHETILNRLGWPPPLYDDVDYTLPLTGMHNRFMETTHACMSTCIRRQSLKHKKNVPWHTKKTTWHIRMWNAAFQAARRYAKPFTPNLENFLTKFTFVL